MLWVSHDLDQVGRIADRTIVLVAGRVAGADEEAAFLRSGQDPDRGRDDASSSGPDRDGADGSDGAHRADGLAGGEP
jgi:ABC-type glutathione transport system ATPase component